MRRANEVLATLFLIAAALFVAVFLSTYFMGLSVLDSNQRMASQKAVLEQLDRLLSTMKDAETGQRGYLLTGNPSYLEPYEEARRRLGSEQAGLRRLGQAGALPIADIDGLDQLIAEKLSELARTIQLRNTNFAAALAEVNTGRGKAAMDRIREKVAALSNAKEVEYEQASDRLNRSALGRTSLFVVAALVNLAFLGWSYRRLRLEMERREAITRRFAEEKERLATTLASIGDGVILTDAAGRVTFLNGTAERLTGWNLDQARERPLPEVFRIVNETTRQGVESPVEKVLRLGHVVGLANHTVLIAKDGHEIPIDDSAAPIKHQDGTLFGVVLVFRDFTAHKSAERALVDAQGALQAQNERLDQAVRERTAKLSEMVSELQHVSYSMAHDMRAPLRAMSGFAQALLEESHPDEGREYCRRILASARRLDQLLVEALNYTKAVLTEIHMEPVNLSELLRDLIGSYPNLSLDEADIRLEGELPSVMGSESLLTQCFSNLLGNAVKFVAPGTRPIVLVRGSTHADRVRVTIQDNGIGIPQSSHSRLFGMFQKLNTEYDGTGIGLAIVRKVVERMGGTVGVESKPGSGSTFWVELPKAPEAPAPAAASAPKMENRANGP